MSSSGFGRLALSAIGTPSADSDAGATDPRWTVCEHLRAVGCDQHGLSAEDRADTLLPDVAGDGQHHPGLEYLLRGGGSQLRRHHRWVESQPETVGDRHRRQRLFGGFVRSEQVARWLTRLARRSEPVPQCIPSAVQRRDSRPLDVTYGPRPTHLTDIAIGQDTRGEGDQVTVLDASVAACPPPRML